MIENIPRSISRARQSTADFARLSWSEAKRSKSFAQLRWKFCITWFDFCFVIYLPNFHFVFVFVWPLSVAPLWITTKFTKIQFRPRYRYYQRYSKQFSGQLCLMIRGILSRIILFNRLPSVAYWCDTQILSISLIRRPPGKVVAFRFA